MSSSPSICASPNFTFPAPTKIGDYTSADKLEHRVLEDHLDYFNHPKVKHSSHNSAIHHKSINDSVSSLSSNTSDITLYENSHVTKTNNRNDSVISTETLVEESEPAVIGKASSSSQKNTMNLRLNLSKHKQNQSFSSIKEFRSGVTHGEILHGFEESFKAASAQEPTFNFGDTHLSNNLEKWKCRDSLPSSASTSSLLSTHSSGFVPPVLRKQSTLPSLPTNMALSFQTIKNGQSRRLQPSLSLNFKDALVKLSPKIKFITPQEAQKLVKETVIVNHLPALLVIDIRSFTDYVKGHIRGSLNVSLPSTLLKRPNYSLSKCVNSLPQYEKAIIKSYILNTENSNIKDTYNNNAINENNDKMNNNKNNINDNDNKNMHNETIGAPKANSILLYENVDNSPALYHFCKKFTDFDNWKNDIYILDSGFGEFQAGFPQSVESGNSQNIDITLLTHSSMNNSLPCPAINGLDAVNENLTFYSPIESKFDAVSTPIISNFSLPELPKSTFKIRHNEEVLSNDDISMQNAIKLVHKSHISDLPEWIRHTLDSSSKLNKDFSVLEQYEKKRLLNALSLAEEQEEDTPIICSGIEFGHKNRYKDIFLYEHSRVKLQHCTNEPSYDYINASYINPSYDLDSLATKPQGLLPHVRYIATQGPLNETIGDFWKCIINHEIPLVISLTDEYENGVGKCSPFWIAGEYSSGENLIKVNCLKEELLIENFLIRLFEVRMDNFEPKIVLQLHQLGWPDMGAILNPDDIIRVIVLKRHLINYIFEKKHIEYPTLIHCSAGCGRTGTLCTIDSIINIILANDTVELPFDPVYPIVDGLRKQRISMVQNLRQYFLIYDCLLQYLSNYKSMKWDGLLNSSIINEFMKEFI